MPEPIGEPDPPADEWVWPLAADGRTRLRRLGPDGRYRLVGTFRGGGQAYVWYAVDEERDLPVAIKILRADGPFGAGRIPERRMIREARIMGSLPAHPNVMPTLGSGPPHLVRPDSDDLRPGPGDSRDPWLVMPLTPHHRLNDLIADGPPPLDYWLRLARGYASGLAHLHDLGIVHRDLSPGNVLLTAAGPVITDFGVSWAPRWIDDGIEQTMSTGLTRQGVNGTPDWHAPEVISSPLHERPDRRPSADVFSWGLFVAGASAGRHPWSKTLGSVALEDFERTRMRHGVPAYPVPGPLAEAGDWAGLVLDALAPDPADRPTAAELVTALDEQRSRWRRRPRAVRRKPALDDDATAAAEVLHEALRERWRSDPVWVRVGSGRRLPIGWAPGAADENAAPRLIDTWQRDAGSGRMVVLGAAGSGKSELLVGVFRELLTGWRKGEPVPLLIPLASWDPALTDLRTWLIEWLHVNHRFLDGQAQGPVRKSKAAKLLDDQHLALILDGLDEVLDKAGARTVVDQLNNLDGPAQLLVSCRDAHRELFPGGATIALGPQDLETVTAYLRGGAAGEQRWDPVVASLPHRPDLAGVLRTPLMVMLADSLAHPRELLDRHGTEEITHHLLQEFVPARYTEEPTPYEAPEARRWLGYLARMVADTGELRWWELRVTSLPSSRALLHTLTLLAVITWTALSAGVMNTWVFGSTVTGTTDAIRIAAAAVVCYAALYRIIGSYPAAVLAVVGAYITGTLSGSYDLALGSGLAAGFSWRPLRVRAPGRGGDLARAFQVGLAAMVVTAAIRTLSLFVPLDDALVVGFGAGTFDGFALRWDEDVNGWLATGLVAGLLTWIGIQVTRGGPAPASSRWWARPAFHGLVAAVLVGAINSWADGARPGIDQPWLLGPGDGLAAGIAVWWVSSWSSPRLHRRSTRFAAAGLLGGLTTGLNLLGYAGRTDVDADVVRALGEGAAVALLVLLALRERRPGPQRRSLRQILPPVLLAGLAGLVLGLAHVQSAGASRGAAFGVAVTLAALFFLARDTVRSGPGRIDPIEAGVAGLTVVGLVAGFAYALLFGLVCGLASRVSTDISQRKLPSLRISAPWTQIAGGALLGTMAAFAAATSGFPAYSLAVIGLSGGVAGAYAFGIRGDDPSNRLAASPATLFRQDRRVFLRMTAVIAVAIGIAVGFRAAAGGQSALAALTGAIATLATYGLTAGLVIAASSTRYGVFVIRNAWLAAGDDLPWRLMPFLDDAHRHRQVLRAAGSAYQFRHELLREQIAATDP
ncbi:serine/threonine-protein kinase [Paractinoplanes lichenicola]|uniref:Protein kinase n=1 Tax=Paractinoplanes lichenicola TaxID=2802976 RepID=A0ABS1VJJ3_9ACTN|nr:serine/threonine-protein kinase [Actinoplanes lichenicola]MBL7253917.1 protein kinase [Actinoplanes lichenicola]